MGTEKGVIMLACHAQVSIESVYAKIYFLDFCSALFHTSGKAGHISQMHKFMRIYTHTNTQFIHTDTLGQLKGDSWLKGKFCQACVYAGKCETHSVCKHKEFCVPHLRTHKTRALANRHMTCTVRTEIHVHRTHSY